MQRDSPKSKATREITAALSRTSARWRIANLKPKCAGSILRDGFALLLFESCDHLPNAIMFATRREDFQTFFLRTPLQYVDVHIADTPVSDVRPGGLIKIDSVGADQGVSVIVDDVFFAGINEAKARSERVSRPI